MGPFFLRPPPGSSVTDPKSAINRWWDRPSQTSADAHQWSDGTLAASATCPFLRPGFAPAAATARAACYCYVK